MYEKGPEHREGGGGSGPGALQAQFSSFPEQPSCFLPTRSPGPQGYWEQKGTVSKHLKFLLRPFVPSGFLDFSSSEKTPASDLKPSYHAVSLSGVAPGTQLSTLPHLQPDQASSFTYYSWPRMELCFLFWAGKPYESQTGLVTCPPGYMGLLSSKSFK